MKVVKCTNGHFFDEDSYVACPHCGAAVASAEASGASGSRDEKKGLHLFGSNKKKPASAPAQDDWLRNSMNQNYGSGSFSQNKEMDVVQYIADEPVREEKSKNVTLDFWQEKEAKKEEEKSPILDFEPEEILPEEKKPEVQVPAEPEVKEEPKESAAAAAAASLQATIKAASASTEGKTMSYFSAVRSGVSSAAPAASQASVAAASAPASAPAEAVAPASGTVGSGSDPVTGWLVCVAGPHFGSSFYIGAGLNSVGRNPGNRIVISGDGSVSREKHAMITYEPKHRKFYVKPGESSGLTYVNDDFITETRMLNPRDIIQIGNTKLLFVPLCDDTFSWEDYMKE